MDTYKYIYLIQSLHMDVIRHTWICQKQFPILNQQYVKTEFGYDVDFLYLGK